MKKLKNELDFIEQLRRRFPAADPVQTGIGDDGAVLIGSGGRPTVVVTDMLLDGVHFDLKSTPAELVGRKAVAVSLSDLAAMACRPTAAFVSIAVPGLQQQAAVLDRLFDGIAELSEHHGFTVAGGDTNSWNGPVVINVCMTGVPFSDTCILRSGSCPGDRLFVTGPLGGSLASGRHLTFEPRLKLAEYLVQRIDIHAMIDLSDGLALDLHRLMNASGTGALVQTDRIPIHSDVPQTLPHSERLQAALSDGEDFELLLAIPADQADAAMNITGAQLFPIGDVTAESGCRLQTGTVVAELAPAGWQHR